MFSTRITGDLAPNRLTEAIRRRRSSGLPIIDLTLSNPTAAGFDYPDNLLAPLASARGLAYAPEPLGLIDARRAVSEEYARRGVAVAPERVVLVASTSDAYAMLFKILASPGDEILVPRPSYPLFEHLTAFDGVIARAYDLEYHEGWSIDVTSVERAIGPRTRALLVVHPNNPTGSFVSPGELDRLAALCAARDMALVADEVFADYELEPGSVRRAGSMLTRDDVLVCALGGLSKSVGLPQVKLGWIAVAGPPGVAGEALERLELVCDTYLSVSTPVQLAARELLERGAAIRAQIASRTVANYRWLKERAASLPSVSVLRADAGWYAVLRVPTLQSEEDLVVDLLAIDGVLIHPGYFFDFPRESYLIVSLLPPERIFADGIDRVFSAPALRLQCQSRDDQS